jgi:hypothetical protein
VLVARDVHRHAVRPAQAGWCEAADMGVFQHPLSALVRGTEAQAIDEVFPSGIVHACPPGRAVAPAAGCCGRGHRVAISNRLRTESGSGAVHTAMKRVLRCMSEPRPKSARFNVVRRSDAAVRW